MSDTRSSAIAGKYRLGQRLAVGGMAEIFRATAVNGSPDALVIKRLLPKLASDPQFIDMFTDEARLCAQLHHKNIVRVYDFEATNDGLYLVMEHVNGPDLLTVLQRCAGLGTYLPSHLAAYMSAEIFHALAYAHSATAQGESLELVHRDVSPSNILIGRNGSIKLADFGIAYASRSEGPLARGSVKGKQGYMSPEQLSGGAVDHRSDLFSAGIVLAEMLIGHRLFAAGSELDALLMVQRADLSRLDKYGAHIPQELRCILDRTLQARRDNRYSTASEVRTALCEWLASSDQPVDASHVSHFIADLEQQGGRLCTDQTDSLPSSPPTMSGPQTRLARVAVTKAAAVGRQIYALGGHTGQMPSPLAMTTDSAPPELGLARDCTATRPTLGAVTLTDGTLADTHLVDVLCAIAQQSKTGKLVVQNGDSTTEAYFYNGNPEFVRSNVMRHRFGEYLVARNVLSRGQLERALAAMPQCGGRLGQTLVSLNLITAVDAVRLLADQVAFKLLDTCSWRSGQYEFHSGERNPWPALQLHLNTYHVIADSLELLPGALCDAWIRKFARWQPIVNGKIASEFNLEGPLHSQLCEMSGERALRDIVGAVPHEQRHVFVAAAYALWRCGAIDWSNRQLAGALPRVNQDNRRTPRIAVHMRGELSRRKRTGEAPLPVEVCNVTADGIGLRPVSDDRYHLSRGLAVTIRFEADGNHFDLAARVVWCTNDGQHESDIGIELDRDNTPPGQRDAYKRWVRQLR